MKFFHCFLFFVVQYLKATKQEFQLVTEFSHLCDFEITFKFPTTIDGKIAYLILPSNIWLNFEGNLE